MLVGAPTMSTTASCTLSIMTWRIVETLFTAHHLNGMRKLGVGPTLAGTPECTLTMSATASCAMSSVE